MILPDYYEFCCRVKLVAGHDALEKIPDLLAEKGAKKPLIITDKGVAGAGLINIISQALGDRVSASLIADNVPPDSDLKVVHQLAQLYRDNVCDAIIAVGGSDGLQRRRRPETSPETPDRRADHGRHRIGSDAGCRYQRS